MLQQTQVATATPYFIRFMELFPTVSALANAAQDEVLASWAGLGYYARARNLHKAAQVVLADYAGEMPATRAELEALPGIGRSTAAAIVSLTDNQPEPILDGNVKRVLARHAGVRGWPGKAAVLKTLWAEAEARMPEQQAQSYNQGLMDLGSMVCTRSQPRCGDCPVAADCVAKAEDLTAELPSPKPKKALPKKAAVFLVASNERGEIYLERRPPVGIWGGLWCLPQFENLDELTAALAQAGIESEALETLPAFEHGFSHYRLAAQPYHLCLGSNRKTLTIADSSGELFAPEQMAERGLPAPIATLLRNFCGGV